MARKPKVTPEMRDRARQLRKDNTQFEQSFWYQVRAGRMGGFKFRRQQPIGPYVVDFVCQQARLVVELDGSQHLDRQDHDQSRDQWLRSQGYTVLRIWNHDWEWRREAVMNELWGRLLALVALSPAPSPQEGEGSNHAGRAGTAKKTGKPCS